VSGGGGGGGELSRWLVCVWGGAGSQDFIEAASATHRDAERLPSQAFHRKDGADDDLVGATGVRGSFANCGGSQLRSDLEIKTSGLAGGWRLGGHLARFE